MRTVKHSNVFHLVAQAVIAGIVLAVLMVSMPAVADSPAEVRERVEAAIPVSWQLAGKDTAPPIALQILSINDFHGQLAPGLTLSNRPVGSAPVLASYLKAASQGMEDRTFIVEAGDLVGASPPYSALLQDEPSIMFLNMLGNRYAHTGWPWDYSPQNNLVGIPGNHEFDEGVSELQRLMYGGNYADGPFLQDPYEGAAFPMICANVVAGEPQAPVFSPICVKNIRGVRVGFIGAVLKQTPSLIPSFAVGGLTFRDEAEAINEQVALLKDMHVRSIVVVLHQGGTQSRYNGDTSPTSILSGDVVDILNHLDGEVDVVITGHTHSFSNALVPNRAGNPMLVVQAFSSGTAYADIDMKIDKGTGDVVAKSAQVITTYADAGPGLTPDPAVASLVQAAADKVAPILSEVVGQAASGITRTLSGAGECAAGNLVADAQRATTGTDFSFENQGGLRANIAAGEVTYGELLAVQPFGDFLVTMHLTGAQIKAVLEQQMWPGQTPTRMLQISGLTYTWDALQPVGSRVVGIFKGGSPIDPTAVYSVTANTFLAEGGDGFTVFTYGTDRVVGVSDVDALVGYVKGLPQPFSAAVEGRITRLN